MSKIMQPAVVFDVDGTILNINHRRHFLEQKPKNWHKFNAEMINDTINDDILALMNMFHDRKENVLIATGRDALFWEVTEKTLRANGVMWTEMYMRPAKDNRPDHVVKREMLDRMRADGFEPWLVFDDRDQVVKMWRDAGIRCLQVAPGAF